MEQLNIIKTLAELERLKEYLRDKDYIAVDTETTGLNKDDEIIGFSICVDINIGYYVILSAWNPQIGTLEYLETTRGAKDFFIFLKNKSLIFHNSPFDCSMVNNNYGVELIESVVHDTMIGGHLLNENRHNGLKERGVELFGEDARKEQEEMKTSVHRNGGVLTKEKYELYKADVDLIAKYGAKDAILTLKVFYHDVPLLFAEKLDKFFYEDESMPLLRGPTYELNTVGLRVDPERLAKLKGQLETEILEAKAFIYREIDSYVKDKYKATKPANTFNINAGQQLAWLLFFRLGNEFNTLTKGGRVVCKALGMKLPYSAAAKREFIRLVTENKGQVYEEARINPKTKKMGRPKKVGDPWKYIACGRESLKKLESKYEWAKRLLEYKKNDKLLGTYVLGIQSRMRYNVIRPGFLQHGTTSGRYSCKNPNFQNLPRDDKRIKACIVSRPGKVFVGADYAQLEPRVFASFSGDERLQKCFESGDDFYSVIGMEAFDVFDCEPKKEGDNAFGSKYKKLRDIAKVIALSATYGTTAPKMAPSIGKSVEDCQIIIDSYFNKFPKVKELMQESHRQAMTEGRVVNLFGRPRRMPKAMLIEQLFGDSAHDELPYEWRNLLNLAINHRIQSTGASIMNRAAIAFWKRCRELGWNDVKLVLQVHDELVVECPEGLAQEVVFELKHCMETTIQLPGVILTTEPKIGYDLAELK